MNKTKVKLDAIRKLLEMPEPSENKTESSWKEWYLRPDRERHNFLVRIPVVLDDEEIDKIVTVMCCIHGKLCLAWDHTAWNEDELGRIGGGGTWEWMERPK